MDHVDKTSFKSGYLDEKAQKSWMINISEKLPKNLMTILRKFRNEKKTVKS